MTRLALRGETTLRLKSSLLVMTVVAVLGPPGCGPDCDDLKKEAKELKDTYAACSSGDACVVVDMYSLAGANNCLAAFQCSGAVRDGSDLDAFGSRARAIASDYEDCSECSMAGCADPSVFHAECNASTGQCELVP